MKFYVLLFFSLVLHTSSYTQDLDIEKGLILKSVGLNFGLAEQDRAPYKNDNYFYKNKHFKAQINYLIFRIQKLHIGFKVEPSIYLVDYQLLDTSFIQPDWGPDYQELRDEFSQRRSFTEFALNFGLVVRYEIFNKFSLYGMSSFGPMISGQATERLSRGFAFSDVVAGGINYQINKAILDFRVTLRHNSNAQLQPINAGHNSIGIEVGVAFLIE